MDQVELYEQQAANAGENLTQPPPREIEERNNFVIHRIRRLQQSVGCPLRVTELSIGDGHLTKSIAECCDIELLCAEISSRRIDRVKRRLSVELPQSSAAVSFVKCNLDTQWPIAANTADAVIALDIMEHVLDVFGFVANCHKVLRQNGLLLLRVPNVAFVRHRLGLLRGGLPITASWFGVPGELKGWRETHGWDGGHLHFFTIPILHQLLQEQGFRIEECKDAGARLERVRNLWPNLLYANPLIVAAKRDNRPAR